MCGNPPIHVVFYLLSLTRIRFLVFQILAPKDPLSKVTAEPKKEETLDKFGICGGTSGYADPNL